MATRAISTVILALALATPALAQGELTSPSFRLLLDPTFSGGGGVDLHGTAVQAQGVTIGPSSPLGVAIGPASGIVAHLGFWPTATAGVSPDADGDGVLDSDDNCVFRANPDQIDTDGDDIGNVCDCDFDQNAICDIADFNDFLSDFSGQVDSGIGSDMDGDGVVGIGDFNLFLSGFTAGSPGSSGLVP